MLPIIQQIKEAIAKQSLLHTKAKNAQQLKEKLHAIDFSYENVLTERLEGARNRAITLIIIGVLLVTIPLIFSDYLPSIEKKANESADSAKESLYKIQLFTVISDFLFNIGRAISDFLYFTFKGTIISDLVLWTTSAIIALINAIAFVLPAIGLFAILVYFNHKEEVFWYNIIKEKKTEKKTKAATYMAQPFVSLALSYIIMTIILFLLSLAKCDSLACKAASESTSLGANALRFSMIFGLYLTIIGIHYITKWIKAMQMGLDEIKKNIVKSQKDQ